MLKRLIEVALPLKEISEQSAREKSIRHGHISTLHIWWARRPLAACRAALFASLIPDPDDPECPESFRKLVRELLGEGNKKAEFRPKNSDGSAIADTPRNRCLEFIKHLVRWENSNNPEYIEPARKLIAAAHKFLHPGAEGDAPKVLDPFAGGGSIPLEALRLGCEAHAIDLNPVAYLILLCTLVYPQKYGQPDSRPVPDYIKQLIAYNRSIGKSGTVSPLFDKRQQALQVERNATLPDLELSEQQYRDNPLVAEVRYWGYWLLAKARQSVGQYYRPDPDGSVPVAYLWARTVKCPNPACGGTIPCIRQLWLCKKQDRRIALKMHIDVRAKKCHFSVVESRHIDFDPDECTMQRGQARCPFCATVASSKYLQQEGGAGRIGQQLMAVVTSKHGQPGKQYRPATEEDLQDYAKAVDALERMKRLSGPDWIPGEPLKAWSGVFNAPLFGMAHWADLFNARQLLVALEFANLTRGIPLETSEYGFGAAVRTYLAFCLSKVIDRNAVLCTWQNTGEKIGHVFGRQALPMIWDYVESNPLGSASGNWEDVAMSSRKGARAGK